MVAKGKEFLVERDFSLKAVSWESPKRTASLNITTAYTNKAKVTRVCTIWSRCALVGVKGVVCTMG